MGIPSFWNTLASDYASCGERPPDPPKPHATCDHLLFDATQFYYMVKSDTEDPAAWSQRVCQIQEILEF